MIKNRDSLKARASNLSKKTNIPNANGNNKCPHI